MAALLLTGSVAASADPAGALFTAIHNAIIQHPSWTYVEEVTFTRTYARTARVYRNNTATYNGNNPITVMMTRPTTWVANLPVAFLAAEDWNTTTKRLRAQSQSANFVPQSDYTPAGAATDIDPSSTAGGTTGASEYILGAASATYYTTALAYDWAVYIDRSFILISFLPQGTTNSYAFCACQVVPDPSLPAASALGVAANSFSTFVGGALYASRAGQLVSSVNTFRRVPMGKGYAEGVLAVGTGNAVPDRVTGRYAGTTLLLRNGTGTVTTNVGVGNQYGEHAVGDLPTKFVVFNEPSINQAARAGDTVTIAGTTYTKSAFGVGMPWVDLTGADF